jgi:hypothetical protein
MLRQLLKPDILDPCLGCLCLWLRCWRSRSPTSPGRSRLPGARIIAACPRSPPAIRSVGRSGRGGGSGRFASSTQMCVARSSTRSAPARNAGVTSTTAGGADGRSERARRIAHDVGAGLKPAPTISLFRRGEACLALFGCAADARATQASPLRRHATAVQYVAPTHIHPIIARSRSRGRIYPCRRRPGGLPGSRSAHRRAQAEPGARSRCAGRPAG